MNFIKQPITNGHEAKQFICKLWLEDKLFHFDDDAHDILDWLGEPLFTNDEADHLNQRCDELFEILKDPFLLPLTLIDTENEM